MNSTKKDLFNAISENLNLHDAAIVEVLDIGCGNGALLGSILDKVDPASHLVGINSSEKEHDKVKANGSGIEFQQFKFVDYLDFDDNTFDLVLSIDTLECIDRKEKLVLECHRILKPGAQIVMAHWDWDTQVYNSCNKQIVRDAIHQFSDWKQDWMDESDGLMGRKLWGLLEGSQLFKGRVEAFTLIETNFSENTYGYNNLKDLRNLVKDDPGKSNDYEKLFQEMKVLNERKEYFYSVNSYIYYGEKLN